mmetsp:Transcript_29412/g.64894  ORF Transcript_29412/g.64894 Transcript_29412/m.64894 type:complete len:211 (+) Transcript_29412:506-1138(+)
MCSCSTQRTSQDPWPRDPQMLGPARSHLIQRLLSAHPSACHPLCPPAHLSERSLARCRSAWTRSEPGHMVPNGRASACSQHPQPRHIAQGPSIQPSRTWLGTSSPAPWRKRPSRRGLSRQRLPGYPWLEAPPPRRQGGNRSPSADPCAPRTRTKHLRMTLATHTHLAGRPSTQPSSRPHLRGQRSRAAWTSSQTSRSVVRRSPWRHSRCP